MNKMTNVNQIKRVSCLSIHSVIFVKLFRKYTNVCVLKWLKFWLVIFLAIFVWFLFKLHVEYVKARSGTRLTTIHIGCSSHFHNIIFNFLFIELVHRLIVEEHLAELASRKFQAPYFFGWVLTSQACTVRFVWWFLLETDTSVWIGRGYHTRLWTLSTFAPEPTTLKVSLGFLLKRVFLAELINWDPLTLQSLSTSIKTRCVVFTLPTRAIAKKRKLLRLLKPARLQWCCQSRWQFEDIAGEGYLFCCRQSLDEGACILRSLLINRWEYSF